MGASEKARPMLHSYCKIIWENEFLAPAWGIILKIFKPRKGPGKCWPARWHDECPPQRGGFCRFRQHSWVYVKTRRQGTKCTLGKSPPSSPKSHSHSKPLFFFCLSWMQKFLKELRLRCSLLMSSSFTHTLRFLHFLTVIWQ